MAYAYIGTTAAAQKVDHIFNESILLHSLQGWGLLIFALMQTLAQGVDWRLLAPTDEGFLFQLPIYLGAVGHLLVGTFGGFYLDEVKLTN